MSDIDPTPGTPVTIGDRLGWWRGDVAARLTTLEAQVAALAGTPAGSLAALAAQLASVRNDLVDLRGLSNRNLGELLSEAYYAQAQIQLNSKLLDIREDLDVIKSAMGATPYNDLELGSVRGYLAAILQSLGVLTGGNPPLLQDNTDRQNAGIDLYNGRKYAIWPNPFDDYVITNDGRDISRGSGLSWLGWSVYIQTTDPVPQINSTADAPNMWLPQSGAGAINISVEASYPLKAFLRRPPLLARRIDSVLIGTNSNGTWHGIQWTPDPQVQQTGVGGLVIYSLDNSNRTFDDYKCVLSRGVYRGDNQAQNAVYVSGTIQVGAVNSMYLIWSSPFHIDFYDQ